MLSVFTASLLSVLQVAFVAAAGLWLARRGILTTDFRRALSHLIVSLMLPCLLISKLSASVNLQNLLNWIVVPAVALVYIALGMAMGWLVTALMRPPESVRRVVTAAMAFGNSGYVPMPLVLALAATAPLFRNDPHAGERGVAYISLYLVCMSPCLWGIAFPYLANKPLGHIGREYILSAPFVAVLVGIVFGVTPFLRHLFVDAHAPLRVVMLTADQIGIAAIPCALLVLGANLADSEVREAAVSNRLLAVIIAARLVVLPLIGCAFVVALHRAGLVPKDPMCLLVLMIQAGVPPATNLILMCQVHKQGEAAMSKILVVTYAAAVPLMTVLIAIFLWVVGTL
ncbi:MAG: hypothetical protein A3K19_18440 [Lentisphaerae bacterium RIFOXYB12_FULL_65_16]|nr:MAG: hypothetical protein A3K18_13845 [Lentisphaerae bacterium RIFOXYA12_64_32]OGV92941.1 MAG: hypothetical protein A3K19_18440 [Lentisphaerae bacterium RIFOXYB12_FULL_65_16]